MRATVASYLLFGLGPYPTLDLTAAEVFAISQGAASLPGRWSAISQCTNDGITYAGLIEPAGNGRVAVLIARDMRACMLREQAAKSLRLRHCDGLAYRRAVAARASVEHPAAETVQ
jgi:hypothetical protein